MNSKSIASRRAFLLRAGASLGPLAVASVASANTRGGVGVTDAEAIRALHHTYLRYLNVGEYAGLPALFTPGARVRFEGGVFVGREQGIRRLYAEHFARREAPQAVHVLLLGHPQEPDRLQVAPGGRSASARFHCLIQAQARIVSSLPLIEMARLQGQGIAEWCEAGCFENTYVKVAGAWQIEELRYRTLGDAPALMDRAHRRPHFVPAFTTLNPGNGFGPDLLDRA